MSFNLSLRLSVFCAVLCAVSSAFGDIVYVKPVACGTGDGSSWANAMGSVSNALMVALKTDAPHEVRMARGVHQWKSGMAVGRDVKGVFDPDVSGSYAFAMRGGYAGVSEDETPDNDTNPTYLNCDVGANDHWVKRDLNAHFYNGQNVTVDLGPVIDGDGNVVLPPEVGENELVHIDTGSNRAADNVIFMDLTDNASNGSVAEFSDFTILGGGNAKPYRSGQAAFIAAVSGKYTLKNITFLGCYTTKGSGLAFCGNVAGTASASAVVFDNVKVLNTYSNARIFSSQNNNYGIFKGVVVKEAYFASALSTGAAFYFRSGTGCVLKDCVFEKCYGTSSSGNFGPSPVIGMEQGVGHTYTNCVFRNNFAKGPNVASAINLRSTTASSAAQQISVIGCLFESNKTYTTGTATSLNCLGAVMLGKNNNSLIGCSFKDNLSIVKPTGACAAVYASTVTVGSQTDKANANEPRRSIVNCTFSGNRVEADSASNGATQIFSRSILVNSVFSGNPLDIVIADCTFGGRASTLPDIRWTGLDTTYPVQVLNSYFNGDASNGYVPFVSDTTGMIKINSCMMNGYEGLPAGTPGNGNVFLDFPLGDWETVPGYAAPVLRPAARIAEIRAGVPLGSFFANYAFYPTDANGAHLLASATETVPSTVNRLGDAVDVARPDSAVTIGAVQNLTAAAENGATLFVQIAPPDAGTVTGGDLLQVVGQGEAIDTLTAASVDPSRFTFLGWKLPDGTVYSSNPVLAISSLTDDLRLTAVFSAPMVSYTFDLGIAGTFDASGTSVVQLTLNPGDPLVVPPFTIDEERVVPYGWDVTPPTIVGSESTIFNYQYLEKKFRVIRVDIAGGGNGDGSSWAASMSDLQQAINTAGLWQGEVWVKQGVHSISAPVAMKNNVRVMGGFEGVDGKYADEASERAARDIVKYRSVITSDVNQDDVWACDNVSLGINVISDGQYCEPEFVGQPTDWFSILTRSSNGARVFDNGTAGLDDTAILDGITIYGGVGVYNGESAHPLIKDCTFAGQACVYNASGAFLEGCSFNGVTVSGNPVLQMNGSGQAGNNSAISDCSFRFCRTDNNGVVKFSSQNALFEMRGCSFESCSCTALYNVYTLGVALHSEWGSVNIVDSHFKNIAAPLGHSIVALARNAATVSNCLFEACEVSQIGGTASTGEYPLNITATHPLGDVSSSFYNCTFRDNRVTRSVGDNTGSKNAQVSVVAVRGAASFANCTFDGNELSCESPVAAYPAKAAVVVVRDVGTASRIAVVNCTFNDNEAADGDIYLADRIGNAKCYLVNSIFWGPAGHITATASGLGNPELYVWNSILNGFNPDAAFVAEAAENYTSPPELSRKWFGEAPVVARRVGASSKAKRGGRNVYVDAAGVLCMPVDYAESSFVNAATGKAYSPIGERTVLPDVFGQPRAVRDVTIGAMQAIGGGLLFSIR